MCSAQNVDSTRGGLRTLADQRDRKPSDVFAVDGRVAIVTGASSGIGAHMAGVLAAAGAHVYAGARRIERLDELAATNPRITPIRCDVTIEDDLKRLVDTAVSQRGRLDIVVNNAGLSDAPIRAENESLAQFRSVVDVNLTACFALSRLAAIHMMSAGTGGTIINIASVHGFVASAPNNQAAYVASKSGLVGLTRELAGQWARHEIRVNAIAPGYVPTELTQPMMDPDEPSKGYDYIVKRTPMRRPGRLDELDGVLLLLASDASTFMTGQTVTVDGGWTAQ